MPVDHAAFLKRLANSTGAVVSEGSFEPGLALWIGKREVLHFTDPDVVDIRLTRAIIRERRAALREDERVVLRAGASDWLQVRIATKRDEAFVAALANEAVEANRASTKPGPPPEGAELERRRRFH